MHVSNKSLKNLCCIGSLFVIGAVLAGCNGEDHSNPDLNDVATALHERYGECPLWTLSNVRRIDGAPNRNGYEISYSFVLTVKDPDVLMGHPANLSREDNLHIAAAMFGDSSDPCFYGLFPLSVAAHAEQPPLAHSYQGSGDRIFVRSEQGWHLNTAPPNPRDPATYDQFAPMGDAEVAALQASSTVAESNAGSAGSSAGWQSIFHRLNLMVASLFRGGGSHPAEPTGIQSEATPAVGASTSSQVDVTASNAQEAPAPEPATASSALAATTRTDGGSAVAASAAVASAPMTPALAAPTESLANTPTIGASAASSPQSLANADSAASASQAQAAKLRLLLQKARGEFDRADYPSAVATAEAVLLLDPANAQAKRLRAMALSRAQQRPTALVAGASSPQANVSKQPEAPAPAPAMPAAPQPVSRPLRAADLEGDWRGTYQCGPYIGSGSAADPDAWSRRVTMTIHNGQATLVRQSEGDRAMREALAGNLLPDLSLHLRGTGQRVGAKHPWSADFMGRFSGTGDGATFKASGTLSDWHGAEFRACQLALSR